MSRKEEEEARRATYERARLLFRHDYHYAGDFLPCDSWQALVIFVLLTVSLFGIIYLRFQVIELKVFFDAMYIMAITFCIYVYFKAFKTFYMNVRERRRLYAQSFGDRDIEYYISHITFYLWLNRAMLLGLVIGIGHYFSPYNTYMPTYDLFALDVTLTMAVFAYFMIAFGLCIRHSARQVMNTNAALYRFVNNRQEA